jgi:hypothetical protein
MDTEREPMEEATCPLCHKPIRSDAHAPEFCALCGMGIYHPETAPSINTMDEYLYFCCCSCLRIYARARKGVCCQGDNDDEDVC